ncbi:UbiD family decarboxylase, partial [bacterium]|nr:UbiD family decarboxylase [candidate division CSSED10-310 bacterium]
MDIRSVVDNLRKKGQLEEISTPVSRHLAAAGRIAAASPRPVYFHDLDGYRVAANLVTGRQAIADALGLPMEGFLAALNERLRDGGVIEQVKEPPCQELVIDPPDLTRLPILLHYPGDGGPYLTSGVWVVEDPVNGRNLSYHRMMLLDDRTGVARVVEGRGMARALSRGGPGTPVAVCIGVPYNVLIAAALSPAEDLDECILAARLGPLQLAPCRTIELEVPAATEIVLEMRYTGKTAPEGPFLDITKTTDIEREQPVFEVSAITMRRDPIYHALLPAGIEHCSLMGLPKELDIYAAVSRTCEARDVVITPGGCSWLHAVIAIAVRDRK